MDADSETLSYIYNDLSVSYVEYMMDRLTNVFDVSDFQHANPVLIHKQAVAQAKFYETCSAIFCMGHWLQKFLVDNGLPESKVVYVGGGNIDSSLIQPRNKTKNKNLFVGKDFKRNGG